MSKTAGPQIPEKQFHWLTYPLSIQQLGQVQKSVKLRRSRASEGHKLTLILHTLGNCQNKTEKGQ